MIVLFFASTTSSMILRMPAAIRAPQNTVLVGTTRRESLTSTNTVLQSDTLRDEEENYGIAYSGDNRLKFGPKASTPGFLRKTFPSFPWHFLPNWLTYCRCVAIPMLVIFFYSSRRNVITSGIFAAASATDYLDGYLARKWDVSSEFGAFLDPVVSEDNGFNLIFRKLNMIPSKRLSPRIFLNIVGRQANGKYSPNSSSWALWCTSSHSCMHYIGSRNSCLSLARMDGGKRITQLSSSWVSRQAQDCHYNVIVNGSTLSSNYWYKNLDEYAGSLVFSTLPIHNNNCNQWELILSSSCRISRKGEKQYSQLISFAELLCSLSRVQLSEHYRCQLK